MKRLMCFILILAMITLSVPVYAGESIPKLEKGILTYGDKKVDFGCYEFDVKDDGFYIPGGVCGSGLYYKPVELGDYIYLAGAIFIPEDVDFDNSSSYKNQKVKVGTSWTCVWRFKKDTLKPQLIAHCEIQEEWGCPYNTGINEGDKDNMGSSTEGLYNWGADKLTPQLIVSTKTDRLYLAYECYIDKVDDVIYQLSYFTSENLKNLKGSHEAFYVDHKVVRPKGGEPGQWWFIESGENEFLVISYPKGYTGEAKGWWVDFSSPAKPKVTKVATRHMKNGKMID